MHQHGVYGGRPTQIASCDPPFAGEDAKSLPRTWGDNQQCDAPYFADFTVPQLESDPCKNRRNSTPTQNDWVYAIEKADTSRMKISQARSFSSIFRFPVGAAFHLAIELEVEDAAFHGQPQKPHHEGEPLHLAVGPARRHARS